MLNQETSILYDQEPGVPRFLGRFLVDHVELHPDGFRADTDGGIDGFRHGFWTPKKVDQVNYFLDFVKYRVRLLTEDLRLVRIDRNNPIPGLLHVGRDFVAGTEFVRR